MERNRTIAWVLILIMSVDILGPTSVMALTSGPSQPEVSGFSPIGTSDMVNLFSGDMSYNIPLLDVEGYPINLAYNAGVGMDQEASWVGLGWSLNPGIVERHLRGLPDDFNGDQVVRETSLRPNITVGATVGANFELWGVEGSSITGNLTASVSPSYNNYDGAQFSIGMNLGMKSTENAKSTFTAGLGLNSSSNAGLSLQPTIGVERGFKGDSKLTGGMNFGLSMSSRQGLGNVTLGTTLKSTQPDVGANGKSYTRTNWSRNGPGKSFNIGQPTYSPQVSVPMENISISLRVTLGSDAAGFHPHGFIGGSYSKQTIRNKTVSQPAYGYIHLGSGQDQQRALLDFNREKDGPYSGGHTALPIAQLTNDIFAASGQNMGGSYRAYRDEIGHVFDGLSVSTGSGGSLGAEIGIGAGAHFGLDLNVNSMTTRSGDWTDNNQAGSRLRFKRNHDDALEEHVYFREANEPIVERDASLFDALGGSDPKRFTFSPQGGYDMRLNASLTGPGTNPPFPTTNEKSARDPRGQLFSYLTHREVVNGQGIAPPVTRPGSTLAIPGHHMSEVTIVGMDGNRNVYGIPAYNLLQSDVVFNTAAGSDEGTLLVGYAHGTDNSMSNMKGKDRYYSRSTTPPYAYAFLLTSVLSADYSDVDGIPGPSENDLGSYTKFDYKLTDPAFPWRTPVNPGQSPKARLDRGRGAVADDDKGSYSYGTKELWYLDKIQTRNMVAIFTTDTEVRTDCLGVNEDGNKNSAHRQQRLHRIDLWERSQYALHQSGNLDVHPIKSVHFEYDQSLCQNLPNSTEPPGVLSGKSTLKRVWFTYGRSNRGVTSPYVFTYSSMNPVYDLDGSDRWGNFKPTNTALRNQTYPYAEQHPATANANASAWNLTRIDLPSGGRIQVVYEADDYAYVQNRWAHRMFRIEGFQRLSSTEAPSIGLVDHPETNNIDLEDEGRRIYFKVPPEYEDLSNEDLVAGLARDLGGLIYFRFLMKFDYGAEGGWDHVSGYAAINGQISVDMIGSERCIFVPIGTISIDEDGGPQVLPMYRAALEQSRREYSSELWRPNGMDSDPENAPALDLIMSASTALVGLFSGLSEFLQGPNRKAAGDDGSTFGRIDLSSSWIRLGEPSGHKKGGGHRVASVTMSDRWDDMVVVDGSPLPPRTYGQTYDYTLPGGSSSGVAAWEPAMGADENVWRRPAFGVQSGSMGNDERVYQEEPFGESMFPSASVGYSRVVVRDIYPDPTIAAAQGTGHVVNEFFTAKDFPTITRRTDLHPRRRRSNYDVLALLGMKANDHMHTTQGFVVETNDMHGKPHRTLVYGQAEPGDEAQLVSSVEYVYARDPLDPSRLANDATTIAPDGTVTPKTIGRHYEFFADMREYNSKARSGGMAVNTEMVIPIILIPIMLFQFSTESTIYRSGVFVKKIHRFGLVEKVVKMENGSVVSTENLAYDAETGGVLLTRTNNEFEDPVYQLRFPAYWHYDGMGPAYRNIGAAGSLVLTNGLAQVTNAASVFVPGDELVLWEDPANTNPPRRGWVDQVTPGTIHVMNASGAPITGGFKYRVVRSGRRNLQGTDMATLTTLSDPLAGFSGNVFTNILQATAVDMSDDWRTACACSVDGTIIPTSNPFRLNTRGVWRLNRDHAWLADRSRSLENRNTNIRRDGVFTSFDPFYELLSGNWEKEPSGWTMVREVTDYNVRGQELENFDALGIASSATFGYGASLPKTVARNTRYREAGFDSFEDRGASLSCADKHFIVQGGVTISENAYHTGRRSLEVLPEVPAEFITGLYDCTTDQCELQVVRNGANVTLVGGTPPYTLDPVIQQGAPLITPLPNGLNITGAGWVIDLSATDAQGCAVTLQLESEQ